MLFSSGAPLGAAEAGTTAVEDALRAASSRKGALRGIPDGSGRSVLSACAAGATAYANGAHDRCRVTVTTLVHDTFST